MSRWIVRAAAAICAAGYVFVYASGRAGPPIRSDGFSYYVYLPSWFIYHDTSLAAVAQDCCGGQFPD
jgi:protein associated with RNAse G/E